MPCLKISSKTPAIEYDVVVIGSGLAGLTAANISAGAVSRAAAGAALQAGWNGDLVQASRRAHF